MSIFSKSRNLLFKILDLPLFSRIIIINLIIIFLLFLEAGIYDICNYYYQNGQIPVSIWNTYFNIHHVLFCWPIYLYHQNPMQIEVDSHYYFSIFIGWMIVGHFFMMLASIYKKSYERQLDLAPARKKFSRWEN